MRSTTGAYGSRLDRAVANVSRSLSSATLRVVRRLLLAIAVVFAACQEPPPVSIPPLTTAVPPPPPTVPTGLRGDVIAPADVKDVTTGRLVMTWRTQDEEREVAGGNLTLKLIRRMLDRMTVNSVDSDLGKAQRIPYDLPSAPTDAVPVAFFDIEHTFWETFQGAGKGFSGTGAAGGGPLQLARHPAPQGPRRERCDGERFRLLVVEDAQLGKRRFCAYLPASWKAEQQRLYPVILLLPGFGSGDLAYLTGRRHAGDRFDAIAKEMSREAVLVGVDTSVPLGSTYLEDSPVMGAWDTFLVKKALPILERELRIVPRRTARALMGQSTGGYNALSFGMRHSDLFSAIGASSPDAPDVERWMFEPGTRRVRAWIRNWAHIEAAVGGAGQTTSWAASWSPDREAPRGFRLPFDEATGMVDEGVLAQWVAKTPHGLVRDATFRSRVKKDLSGRIMIIVGRNDDFELFAPAESFAHELDSLGIETRFVATDHGHADHLERFEQAFRFVLERLDPAP
jgi:S-formylglutathione hydrolase FrmB